MWLLIVSFQLAVGSSLAMETGAPLLVMEGEGLRFVITSSPDEAHFIGEIRLKGKVFPFKGAVAEENGQQKIVGTFDAGGTAFPFSTYQPAGQEHTVFTTGTKSYKLMPVKQVASGKGIEANPLDEKSEPNPLDENPSKPQPMKPKEINPLDSGDASPAPANTLVDNAAGGRDEVIRFKQVVFPDVSMAGLPAYTMLVPDGWKADGRIQWSIGDLSYPQKHIDITAPDMRRVQIPPRLNFGYLETDPGFLAEKARLGMPPEEPNKGEAPPQDIGQWLLERLQRNNPNITDMRLISQERDVMVEKMMAQMDQQLGQQQNAQAQPVIVTLGMVLDGVRHRQEVRLVYTLSPPLVTQTSRLTLWTVDINQAISGPDATFDRDKGLLYSIANSLRATPKWWTASQELLAQLAAGRAKANLDIIRQMGEQAKQRDLSNDQMSAFKNNMASGDRIQDKQLDRIQEVQPYSDVDGSTVKLSIHYKYTYGDGKGNYVQTNQKLDRPGEYQELEQKN